MNPRLGSVAAVAEHLRAKGDTVEQHPDRLIAVASIGSRLSSVELRWQTKTGSIHAFEVLPLQIPLHALTAAKRLRLPSILSERSAARNSSPESHAKKYPPE